MPFTVEQMRACVLDGGTRFVAPGKVTYTFVGHCSYEVFDDGMVFPSDERQALKDENVRPVLPALGDAVEQLDLAGCVQLTDAIVIEIVNRCPNLRVVILGRVNLRRRTRPLSRSPLAHVACSLVRW